MRGGKSQPEWKRGKGGNGKQGGRQGEEDPQGSSHSHARARTRTASPLNSPASAAPSPICSAADMSDSLSSSPPAAEPPPTPGLCSIGSDCAPAAHWAFLGRGTLTRAHTHAPDAHAPPRVLTLTPAHTHAAAALMCSAPGCTCSQWIGLEGRSAWLLPRALLPSLPARRD